MADKRLGDRINYPGMGSPAPKSTPIMRRLMDLFRGGQEQQEAPAAEPSPSPGPTRHHNPDAAEKIRKAFK